MILTNLACRRSQPSFLVPNTNIRLIFRLGPPMRPDVMQRVILSATGVVQTVLNNIGDGFLPQARDPFVHVPPEHDSTIFVCSRATPHADQRLTWGNAGSALLGLWDFLYLNGIFQEAGFDIYDTTQDRHGHIGYGAIITGQLSGVSNSTQGLSGDRNLWPLSGPLSTPLASAT